MARLKPALNLIEVAMIVVGVAVVAITYGRNSGLPAPPSLELSRLAATYGPSHASQWAEEWIVRDFFQDKRAGIFLDVGAYDYKRLSNTYYLETALGWSGLAVEPQVKFAADYRRFRPRTIFVPLFVGDRSDTRVILNVPRSSDSSVASATKTFVDMYDRSSDAVEVHTITLDDLLAQYPIGPIDFMSMDIELAEVAALRGFTIERHRPTLVCIEAHDEVKQEIYDYFVAHGYRLLTRYLNANPENFWFTPAHP